MPSHRTHLRVMFESTKEQVTAFVGSNFGGRAPRGLPSLPPVTRLSPTVTRVLGGNPSAFTLQGTNSYLIGTGPTRWLLDTGEGKPVFVENLRVAMRAEGVTSLEGILLTHWHLDHVGGVGDVRKLVRELNQELKGKEGGSGDKQYTPLLAYKHVRHGNGEREVDVDGMTDAKSAESHRSYVHITDGQIFDSVPGVTLRAVFTPGHSEDHYCFVHEEEGSIFAGDCVLNGNTAVFEDLSLYSKSLEVMREELENCVAESRNAGKSGQSISARKPPPGFLYPSHGEAVTDGVKKLAQYAKHRETRERMFVDALVGDWRSNPERCGMTKAQLTKTVYGNSVNWLILKTACEGICGQHLTKLAEEGRVVEEKKTRWGLEWLEEKVSAALGLLETKYRPSAAEMRDTR